MTPKEIFIFSGAGAILLLIVFHGLMMIRLTRRKAFGRLWEPWRQPFDMGVSRTVFRVKVMGEEIGRYLSTLFGKVHLFLFVALALTALVTGRANPDIFAGIK